MFCRGHLEILAPVSQHIHRHWNRHQYRHCKTFIFACRIFFLKKAEYFCSFSSVPLCQKYLFFYDFLLIHPKASIAVLEKKRLFELSEAPVHWCFEKITSQKISAEFASFLSETSRMDFFLSALAGVLGIFPKTSLEQILCREPASVCLCKKELHSTRFLRNFPEI